jgi:hypothetical protein
MLLNLSGDAMNPESTKQPSATSEELLLLQREIKRLEDRLGDVERRDSNDNKSWASISNIVSVLSIIIASLTTAYTIQHTNTEDASKRRGELIEYTRQLITMSQDSKHHEEEISTLGNQAADLLPTIPNVSATVYRQVAQSLATDTVYMDEAINLANRAIDRARATNNVYEELAAHKIKALVMYSNRDTQGMRREYGTAIQLAQQYQGSNKLVKYNAPAYAVIQWGHHEIGLHECAAARERLQQAKSYLGLAPTPTLPDQIKGLENSLKNCQ